MLVKERDFQSGPFVFRSKCLISLQIIVPLRLEYPEIADTVQKSAIKW